MAANTVQADILEDECNSPDANIIGLGCSRETFTEHEEVAQLIENIGNPQDDFRAIESQRQRFVYILDQYQEQPHLIDKHLENLLSKIIYVLKNENLSDDAKHVAFRYLYVISKVRGFKVISRNLPHEVADLQPLLNRLEAASPEKRDQWETHYGLLLWLSIVIKIPFHLQRFDTATSKPIMDRIFDVCKKYLFSQTAAQDIACYLTALYITRPDVQEKYFPEFSTWSQTVLNSADFPIAVKKGIILSLAGIFKHGQRSFFLNKAAEVLQMVSKANFQPSELLIVQKSIVKLVQRLGLTFLKPRIAAWRYQRGSRSLAANLVSHGNVAQANRMTTVNDKETEVEDDDDDEDIVDEVEETLEILLQALRDKNRDVQWCAAKGIGRLTNRLPKLFADQVLSSVLELFCVKESDMAWHGGCLALAELSRRGLLLPERLPQVLPLLEQALTYDELRGSFSVGSAVRDAACYVCWAFARAFDPRLLQPYVNDLARALLITTVYDREVNCRRAAAAAFQEHVGRQGTFAHGIDIVTTCDYFSVGLRKNAYLKLSIFLAQFDEYRAALIDHLSNRKVSHWDAAIRQLTATTFYELTLLDPVYIKEEILPEMISNCCKQDLHLRQGSVLSVGEILKSLSAVAQRNNVDFSQYLGTDLLSNIHEMSEKILDDRFLRGLGGDAMKQAVTSFIGNCSEAHLPIPKSLQDHWTTVLGDCLSSLDSAVQSSAVSATATLVTEYVLKESPEKQQQFLGDFVKQLSSSNQNSRMGHALALGKMPVFMLVRDLRSVIEGLRTCSAISPETLQWAESRRDSLTALAQVCTVVGLQNHEMNPEMLKDIFSSLLRGLNDYTVDSRGDIGAMVREAAISSLSVLCELTAKGRSELLTEDLVEQIMGGFVKQATEQIRRTRLLAAGAFANLLYCDPPIPHLREREELKKLIPPPPFEMSTEKETYDLWIQIMKLKNYRKYVLMGLVSTIGGLTESLVKSASAPLFTHLRHLPKAELEELSGEILETFAQHLRDARFMPYMFGFLDRVLSSGSMDLVIKDWSQQLFDLIRAEMSSGSKPMKLLLSSIDLYCHLLHGSDETFRKSVNQLLTLLTSRFPRVRKVTASKLYEALLTLAEMPDALAANQEEILNVLSETNWDNDVEILKPLKTQLKNLFGV